MVKKILIVVAVLVVLALAGVFGLFQWINNHCEGVAPERLGTIPSTSYWKGTCQEGFWFDILEQRGDTIRMAIYNDYNGEMVLDAYFMVPIDCDKQKINPIQLKELLLGYENYSLLLPNDYCNLKAIIPPQGGSFWELDKVHK